jgi:preprotein translocase subunit SecG
MLSLNHIPAPMTSILAANWLNISINLLLVIHVVICLLLALVVLMQRPKQEGLGAAFGGGLTDQAFGARTTDVLQKGTVYLGTFFFIVTLVLAILIGKRQSDNPTLTGVAEEKVEIVVEAEEAPEVPGEVKAAVQMPKLPAQDVQPEAKVNEPAAAIPSDVSSVETPAAPSEVPAEPAAKPEPAEKQ